MDMKLTQTQARALAKALTEQAFNGDITLHVEERRNGEVAVIGVNDESLIWAKPEVSA